MRRLQAVLYNAQKREAGPMTSVIVVMMFGITLLIAVISYSLQKQKQEKFKN